MLKALIIDSNATARDLLAQILTNGTYEVIGSTNTAPKGVGLAAKHQPHLVCINAEQMNDGAGVLDELRAAAPKALVFMVSAQLDAATLQDAVGRGVNGFIVKPFNELTVLNTIRKTVLAFVRKQQAQAAGT